MLKIIECVPNFSEGKNHKVIESLAAEIRSVEGVKLLDYSADPDHNRSVFTFIGNPKAVLDAAFRSASKAIELIDISKHQGVHPRIGAVDVIPFIPLKNVTLAECVKIAHKLGKRITKELKVPVYFYEEAAACAENKNLANIRKGGFTKLPKFHPSAGAVAVGARDFLIAFNVNLASNDLEIAKTISKKIRDLPCVKALGVPLATKGIVQVSMNLTNFRETGLKDAFDAVSAEAEKNHAKITNSEIIGLIPQAAVFQDMKDYLKLEQFDAKKILETYL